MPAIHVIMMTGHAPSCPVRDGHSCSQRCKQTVYSATGALAFLAGILEGTIGWIAGSAFVLSDAAHAVADSAADFYGVHVEHRIEKAKEHEQAIRKHGSKIIALLLVLAAVPAVVEIYRGAHIVPIGMIVAGACALAINVLRWSILRRGQNLAPVRTRQDLVNHAKTDVAHSAYVFGVGALFLLAEKTAANVFLGLKITIQTQFGELTWRAVPENIDTLLAIGVIAYMLWQAWRIWTGKGHHHHDHGHAHRH